MANSLKSDIIKLEIDNLVNVKQEIRLENAGLTLGGINDVEDNQTVTAASDLLQNGILVETNKGLVCMSLKDVLSSNLNLSEEDFHKVAAQLLLQQDLNDSDAPSENCEISDGSAFTAVPMQKPISISVSYKSNIQSSSDESTVVTQISDNFSADNSEQQTNSEMETNLSNTETIESQPESNFETDKPMNKKPVTKRRGGWPKGRKRKPELLNLPPKAPKTSYNIFLNERRKLYKDKLAFHEITRVVGNQWSNLSAEEKQPYIEKALEDKMRYRQELMAYRQSDAYKLYLVRKRKKRSIDNLMSESDMDGTDDFDDEPEDLYCDMCDQWFYNLHNKREHLLSRQHKMLLADDMYRELASSDSEYRGHSTGFSTSLDESSLDAAPIETNSIPTQPIATSDAAKTVSKMKSVSDFMSNLFEHVLEREKEIQLLQNGIQKTVTMKSSLMLELGSLKDKMNNLKRELTKLREEKSVIDSQIYQLWQPIFTIKNSKIKCN